MTRENNIKRFESLIYEIAREGTEELLSYIRNDTDFYIAPASTKFHLACEGGLLQHSLNVYDCLRKKRESPVWKNILKDITDETIIIVSLLHDLCKVNFYTKGFKNQKTYEQEKVAAAQKWQIKNDNMGDFIWETIPCYEINDLLPLGHGEKSIILLNKFIKLSDEELLAIRWHMGFTEEKSQYKGLGDAMEKYPLVLALHEADIEASKLIEDVNGNKEQIWN